MNGKKVGAQFTSYINISSGNNGDTHGAVQEVTPKLLNGEQVTGAAHGVLMMTPLSERNRSRFGSLFVTNYKLSFVPLETSSSDEYSQHNHLLGTFDVPLTCVGAIYLTDGGLTRRKRLLPFGDMPAKVKGLQIVCKNMKVLTFGLSASAVGRTVAMALVHHAFPKRHDLLFAYEHKDTYYPTLPSDLNMFQRTVDWKKELERCGSPHWRITSINGTSDSFMLTAGETLIVPGSVLDCKLVSTARHYRSGRVPIWVWGMPQGAALLRSGELLQTDQSAEVESVFLEQIRRSHPLLTPPYVIYLCGNSFSSTNASNTLPTLAALQTSYKKLVELCTPTTLEGFWVQDSQYYSILESSRWLRHVANCLTFAHDAATHLAGNVTVVLLEGDGVDYCAVVSCLTQLLLDDHYRSISGFQSLVQKEWIALGHPFCDRFGLPPPGSPLDPKDQSPAQMSPVFLLFLDCVWQLTRQFPAHFQFTETYLTTLWDCAHNHLFDTFIFNCPRDREVAVAKKFVQRPVWDWSEQFTDQDKALFYNPLYLGLKPALTHRLPNSVPSKYAKVADPRLEPWTSIAGMELWSQCYERWLLPLDAPQSGVVQYHVHNYAELKQIQHLNEKLTSLSILNNRESNGGENEIPRTQVSRFYPFSLNQSSEMGGNLDSMQVSLIDASLLLDSQSLLNAPD